ncbi:hypothetical protein [Pseudomonas agarici]|nr:hypothetical protein [Pseudomonas agarici]
MAALLETPTIDQLFLDPTLRIYSDRQLAVVGTQWIIPRLGDK